jgi:hypothetical protein
VGIHILEDDRSNAVKLGRLTHVGVATLQLQPVIASEAKQSSGAFDVGLDCFVACGSSQ